MFIDCLVRINFNLHFDHGDMKTFNLFVFFTQLDIFASRITKHNFSMLQIQSVLGNILAIYIFALELKSKDLSRTLF